MKDKKIEKNAEEEFVKIPYELRFLAYFMDLKTNDYRKLMKFLHEPYGGV